MSGPSRTARSSRIKLLLCDIDGTLTGVSGRGHSARLPPLMRRLMARGVRIGVVSGRDVASARAVYRAFNLNGPIIAENGAEMILRPGRSEGDVLACGGLSPRRITGLTKRLGREGLLHGWRIDRRKRRMLTLYPDGTPGRGLGRIRVLSDRLTGLLQDSRPDLEVSRSAAAIDICARGADKGRAIGRACRRLRMPPGAVAFVGDSQNDQTAFDFVRRHHGWVAFVGRDRAMQEGLKGRPRVYLPRRTGSQGSADFVRFLLRRFFLPT